VKKIIFSSLLFSSLLFGGTSTFSYMKEFSMEKEVDQLNVKLEIETKNKQKIETEEEAKLLEKKVLHVLKNKDIDIKTLFFRTNKINYNKPIKEEEYQTNILFDIKSKNFGLLESQLKRLLKEKNILMKSKNYSISKEKINQIKNNQVKIIISKLLLEEKEISKVVNSKCKIKNANIANQQKWRGPVYSMKINSSEGNNDMLKKEKEEVNINVNIIMECER